MPAVNKGESKNDYIARCVPVVVKEGASQDEAVAKCNGMWTQNLQAELDMVEIKGKEIAYPGTFQSSTGRVTLTKENIDEMIGHFDAGRYSPYLNLDHNDKLTDKVKESLKVLRLGTVSKLYKSGERLIADFKEVPKRIAEFIDKGLMNLRSIEFSKRHPGANGEFHGNVLKAVSFFGADVPAIPGLEDAIPVLYKSDEQQDVVLFLQSIATNLKSIQEVKDMDEEKTENYGRLKGLVESQKTEMKMRDSEIETLKTKLGEISEKVVTMQSREDAVEKKEADNEKVKVDNEKKAEDVIKLEAETFIDKLIQDKKRLPKFKESDVERYIELKKADNEDGLKLFKEDLESRGEVVNLTQTTTANQTGTGVDGNIEFKAPSYDTEEAVELQDTADDKNADEAVKAQMKLKGYFGENGYLQAAVEIGILDKSEVPEGGGK